MVRFHIFSPFIDKLKDFCIKNDIDIIEVFSEEVYESKNDYRTRVFAPTFGYLEDPATGSGNSAFGYYLLKNNKLKTESINIEQNNKKKEYNLVKLRVITNNDNENRILFGGAAITRIDGHYIIT